MKNTTVALCCFKRTIISKTEYGIMIGLGDLIIDKNNKPVKAPVWSYTILWHKGTLPITFEDLSDNFGPPVCGHGVLTLERHEKRIQLAINSATEKWQQENAELERDYNNLRDYITAKLATKGEHGVFETIDAVEQERKQLRRENEALHVQLRTHIDLLQTLLERLDAHADGTSDSTSLEKFCNEMVGLYNDVLLKDTRTIVQERDRLRAELLATFSLPS